MFGISTNLTAFNDTNVVGSKVTNKDAFLAALTERVKAFDWSTCRTKGQAFIVMPEALPFVSCGDAPVKGLTDADLVARIYRDVPTVFANRSKAAPATFLATIVYTREAYTNDPNAIGEKREIPEGCDYFIVAVIAAAAGEALSPTRLVHNIAGENNAFIPNGDPAHDLALLHNVIAEARKSRDHAKTWIVVSDPHT